VSRIEFLLGKLLGVMLSAIFCFALFMAIYVLGVLFISGTIPVLHFAQYIYLQLLMLLILATLSFFLSLKMDLDATITITILLYIFAQTLSTLITYIYDSVNPVSQLFLKIFVYVIPQFTLLDFTSKTVHASEWDPLEITTLVQLTFYGMTYSVIFFTLAMISFRKKEL